ncbi:hypothetical protein SBV1_480020 [Verrucomicrobia bacterium]|nr:hypothetical protein SBV1_480020 [Verrucomicrobiota bacterium]
MKELATTRPLTPKCHEGLMANMVEGIPCRLGVDYLENSSAYKVRRALVFTGAIDEFFNFDAGGLGYRSLERVHEFLPGSDWYQPCGQVNHPDAGDQSALLTLEWKHLMPPDQQQRIRGTLITREFPFTPEDSDRFEYPVPTACHAQLYGTTAGAPKRRESSLSAAAWELTVTSIWTRQSAWRCAWPNGCCATTRWAAVRS